MSMTSERVIWNWVLMSDIVWSPIKLWIYVSSIQQVHVLKCYVRSAPSSRLSDANGRREDQKQFIFQPKCSLCPKQRLSRLLILIVFPFFAPRWQLKVHVFAQQSLGGNASAVTLGGFWLHIMACVSVFIYQCSYTQMVQLTLYVTRCYTTKRLRQHLVRLMPIFFQEVRIYSKVAS